MIASSGPSCCGCCCSCRCWSARTSCCLRRKKKAALHYASLSLIREALGAGQRFRRHVPPLLFLVALTLMLVAIARPTAVVTLPSQHETVILAMDVSGSMRATDVKPNRLVAAQEAARAFVADQPKTTRIGVVVVRRDRVGRPVADAQPRGHPRPPSTASRCSAARRSAAASSCR